jgi:hypothetical protein
MAGDDSTPRRWLPEPLKALSVRSPLSYANSPDRMAVSGPQARTYLRVYTGPGRPSHERLSGRHGFVAEHVAALDHEWSLLGMTRPVGGAVPGAVERPSPAA